GWCYKDQQSTNTNTPTAKAVHVIETARSRLSRFMARPWFQVGISELDANQSCDVLADAARLPAGETKRPARRPLVVFLYWHDATHGNLLRNLAPIDR